MGCISLWRGLGTYNVFGGNVEGSNVGPHHNSNILLLYVEGGRVLIESRRQRALVRPSYRDYNIIPKELLRSRTLLPCRTLR